ncbi:MarR family EPS-associated transcriptional regulator [Polynucleobacter sp. MWH-Aus1W21]|uniref:MarR family EPS-associated transcriptional regulator n=1 Tax=Polynucleobacter sp. MWH-Aus1W21 TaxID=1855880 RepID=UPI001BFDE6C2|nr:MarR family EPS-associated transcriptional regulator [Polynucleobacter sp. MWH-Aus1W21]QWD66545.1 MarR family EPS-associated transcriptional regulator [Polynucleobacter sp. MWH-Aus1W21]
MPEVDQSDSSEIHFQVLRAIAQNPDLTQRELAAVLGISLGKANYCLKALVVKGLVKIESFAKSKNKLGYAYLLTPQGVAQKAALTTSFLRHKLEEYESLRSEIEMLKLENANSASTSVQEKKDLQVEAQAK